MTNNICRDVKKFIGTHTLCQRGDTIVLGVSGGADSVGLLFIFQELRYLLGIHMHVAHFNHALRKGAAADERFVRKLCQQLAIPFTTEQWKRRPRQKKDASEDEAREARLQFLIKVAKNIRAQSIALAHTQNDLAETVLMRILRGSGLQGLRGILPKRLLYGFPVIRPLLKTSHQDILKYLKKSKVSYRHDPTNFTPVYFRNKIRLELLPYIRKSYQPNIDAILTDLSTNLSFDYDYLEIQARNFLKKTSEKFSSKKIAFPVKTLLKTHKALRHMIFRLAIEHLKGNTNQLCFQHIQELDALLESRRMESVVDLPGTLRARKTDDILSLERNN